MLYIGNCEPPLREVLCDPIVRLLMARDRWRVEEVAAEIKAAQRRLHARQPLERVLD